MGPSRPSRRAHGNAPGNGLPVQAITSTPVARIEVQPDVDDCPVEVQRQEFVPGCDRYRLTSGLRRFGGRPPRTAVAILRAAIADISDRVRVVALAMCGASTTFGSESRPG